MAQTHKNKDKKRQGARKGCFSFKSFLFFAVIGFIVAGSVYLHFNKNHVFDPETLQQIAQSAIEENKADPDNATSLVDIVVDKLRAEYGKHIVEHPEWMFNNAGGAMGAMLVLHCSFSEYIIIFGTPLGTEGHTGRFLADDYFTILHGEQVCFPSVWVGVGVGVGVGGCGCGWVSV